MISIHDFVESFAKGLETRDVYTWGHSIRVAHLGYLIAEKLFCIIINDMMPLLP